MSAENDNSHNIMDSNNEDDDDDDGEAADMEEFEESGQLEMVDPVSFLTFFFRKQTSRTSLIGYSNDISSNQHTRKETNS